MEYQVKYTQKVERKSPSGYEYEVLELFGVSPINDPEKIILYDEANIVKDIKDKRHSFFVEVNGNRAAVRVNHTTNGLEYVETVKDETTTNNLSSLPAFGKIGFRIDEPTDDAPPPKKSSFWDGIKANPFWALPPLAIGALLPILYCLFFGNCSKPCPDCPPVVRCDSCVQKPCPMYDKLFRTTTVEFDFKKDDTLSINPQKSGMDSLRLYATLLKNDNQLYVDIVGYTDYIGDGKYNQKLSERRERSIRDYFVAHGVDSLQIQIQEAFGKRFALNKADSTRRAKDRHVAIRLFGLKKR